MLALGEYLDNRHKIRTEWDGDTGRFKGKYLVVSVEGEFSVEEKQVTLRGKDPGMLWRKKASDYLRHKLEKYLDPQTPLDALPRR
jgi:hypothetical protein